MKRALTVTEKIRANNISDRCEILIASSAELRKKIEPIQAICPHPKIQRCGQEDFIMKHTGTCPDCKKIILPNNIVRTLMNQY
jgi:predicted  nucleic acid-binding Zn ribbon protein